MTDFDDRSGVISCETEWGRWWQTLDEVVVEIDPVQEGTKSKEILCTFKPTKLKVVIKGQTIIEGEFPSIILADDALWTLEDKKMMRIVLTKSDKTAANCWRSLLKGQYEANPITYDQMEKKLTLHRFQLENPGFDFSNADVSGNYTGGGPQMPSS